MGNSGCFPCGKASCAYCVFLCFHNPSNSGVDYRIFNVRTDVNACDCTRECTDTRKRVCTESWVWEKKNPCRTGESNLRQRRDGPMLYQWATSPWKGLHGKNHHAFLTAWGVRSEIALLTVSWSRCRCCKKHSCTRTNIVFLSSGCSGTTKG